MSDKRPKPNFWSTLPGQVVGVILVILCLALFVTYCEPILHVKTCREKVMEECQERCPWCSPADCEAEAAFECIGP